MMHLVLQSAIAAVVNQTILPCALCELSDKVKNPHCALLCKTLPSLAV